MNTLEYGQKWVQMKILGGQGAFCFGFELFPLGGIERTGVGGSWGGSRHAGDNPGGKKSVKRVHTQHLKRTPLFHPGKVICTKAFQPPRIICSALTPYCNEKQIPL